MYIFERRRQIFEGGYTKNGFCILFHMAFRSITEAFFLLEKRAKKQTMLEFIMHFFDVYIFTQNLILSLWCSIKMNLPHLWSQFFYICILKSNKQKQIHKYKMP
mmetsp:Transcript_8158/g.10969  ORF Transcript_8158/g.10969 Transcript_8158/m.10969 type:complete len:104 (+) Transcript_8158:1147-1458(+)